MPRLRLAVVSSHPIQYQAPLFRELARRPIDFSVLFCSDHGTRPTFDPGFGAAVEFDVPLLEGYPYEFLPNWSPRPHIGTTGLVNPELAARVLGGSYDAVVLHGYNALTNALAYAMPRRRSKTKLLLRGDSNAAQARPLHLRIVKQGVVRLIFSRFDHFLTAGTMNQRYYEAFGVPTRKMTLAPFSVDNDFFTARSKVARHDPFAARKRLGLPSDGPLFLFVAKLQPHKRALDALHAFAAARREDLPATLAIVGDGEQRGQIEAEVDARRLRHCVKMLGFQNQSVLPDLYGSADALVLPSESEPWGLVVNEAMACGLAIAASDAVGAASDLVKGNGSTFRPGDTAALAAILRRWIDDPAVLAVEKARSMDLIAGWGIGNTADGFLLGCERARNG